MSSSGLSIQPGWSETLLDDDVLHTGRERQAVDAVGTGDVAVGERVARIELTVVVVVGKGRDRPAREARIAATLIIPVGVEVVVLAAGLGGVLTGNGT